MHLKSVKVLIIFVLSLSAALYFFYFRSDSLFVVRGFSGSLVGIEDDGTIQIQGVFLGDLTNLPQEFSGQKNFSVRTDKSTVFEKSEIRIPTIQEIKAMGGKFNLEDLPRQDGKGSLDDLKALGKEAAGIIRIETYFQLPIYSIKKQKPVVSRLTYRILFNK